jgi:hypothetical protein
LLADPSSNLKEQMDVIKASPSSIEYITTSGRDLRLDFLRGYFIFMMVVDHLPFPSALYIITGGNRFFTSGAEGFLFISGLVTGIVYFQVIREKGLLAGINKAVKRFFTLYIISTSITLGFLALVEHLNISNFQVGLDLSQPIQWLLRVFTLNQSSGYTDVILAYTLLFIVVPFAFILLHKNKGIWLLAASWIVYALSQFLAFPEAIVWKISNYGFLNLAGAQVIFSTGMFIGKNKDKIPRLTKRASTALLFLTGCLAILLVGLFFLLKLPLEQFHIPLDENTRTFILSHFFSKENLGIGRLFTFAVFFTFAFLVVTRWWRWIYPTIGKFILVFGQRSLYAYVIHLPILVFSFWLIKILGPIDQISIWLNLVFQLLAVAIVWTLTQFKVFSPTLRAQKIWNFAPLLIALGIVILDTLLF